MAIILGGIGTSHVPTIGGAYDRKKQNDPDWAPLFAGYERVKTWLDEKRADVLVFFYNDHASTFFFDHYPTFALGVSETYPIADEGLGPRAIPPLKGHAGLARHMADCLVNDEFDISVFQDLPIDHGVHSPLTMFWPPAPDWPGKIVPIEVNVLQHPIPTPMRCWKLGQAVRRAVLSYPEDLKVVIVGTGRPVPPDERRARRLQQRKMGQEVSRLDRARSEEAHRHAARRLHPPRRHRGRGGNHVARHARRAFAAGEEDPPELLPADDHRDGRGAVRRTTNQTVIQKVIPDARSASRNPATHLT